MISSCSTLPPCQSSWPGSDISLSRYSLRFSNSSSEAAFVRSRGDQLVRNFVGYMIVAIILSLIQVFRTFFTFSSLDAERLAYRRYEALVVLAWSCFAAVVDASGRVLSYMSYEFRERLLVFACSVFLLYFQCIASTWYRLKLSGRDPAAEYPHIHFTDSGTLLLSVTMLTCIQSVLPTRWYVVLIAEVTCVVGYTVNVFILGSNEPDKGRFLWLVNTTFVILSAYAKRSSELTERLLFSGITAEKCLRARAEFQLSQSFPASSKRDSPSCNNHCVSELASSIAFRIPGEDGDLNNLVALGQKEHWILPSEQLDFPRPHDRMLGQGAFGVVVPGVFCGKTVAVKVPKVVDRSLLTYLNELRILRLLRHDNIVLFYGACINNEIAKLVFVFELLNGVDFGEFLKRRGFDAAMPFCLSSCKALLDVCAALTYLHSRVPKIIHGDLKDSNTFVEEHGMWPRAKLLDFGLSRLVKMGSAPLGGTLKWMAPELLRSKTDGLNVPLSVSADVFSFGRLIFFVATGERPLQNVSASVIKALGENQQTPAMSWPSSTTYTMGVYRSIAEMCCVPEGRWRPEISAVGEALRRVFENLLEEHANKVPVSCKDCVTDHVAYPADSLTSGVSSSEGRPTFNHQMVSL